MSEKPESYLDPRSDVLPAAEAEYVYTSLPLKDFQAIEGKGFLPGLMPDKAWADGYGGERRYFVGDVQKVEPLELEDDQPVVIRIPRVKDLGLEAYTGKVFRNTPTPADQIEILGKDSRWYKIVIPPAVVFSPPDPKTIADQNLKWEPVDPRSIVAPGPIVVLKGTY